MAGALAPHRTPEKQKASNKFTIKAGYTQAGVYKPTSGIANAFVIQHYYAYAAKSGVIKIVTFTERLSMSIRRKVVP